MLHPTIQILITRLAELTERGEIPWRQTQGGTLRFQSEGYVVDVTAEPQFRVTDLGGREIEVANSRLLREASGDDWAAKVERLAREAMRFASGERPSPEQIRSSLSAPSNIGAGNGFMGPRPALLFGQIRSFDVHAASTSPGSGRGSGATSADLFDHTLPDSLRTDSPRTDSPRTDSRSVGWRAPTGAYKPWS